MASWFKKELVKFEKDEERILFTLFRFRVRKKLLFSLFLSILVTSIGLSKIESLHEIGLHVSIIQVLITLFICFVFLFLTVITKNPAHFSKQVILVFLALTSVLFITTIAFGYSITDILFISTIATAIAVGIYDIF